MFETMLRERKEHAVNQALDTLRKGMDQIEVRAVVSQSVNGTIMCKVTKKLEVRKHVIWGTNAASA